MYILGTLSNAVLICYRNVARLPPRELLLASDVFPCNVFFFLLSVFLSLWLSFLPCHHTSSYTTIKLQNLSWWHYITLNSGSIFHPFPVTTVVSKIAVQSDTRLDSASPQQKLQVITHRDSICIQNSCYLHATVRHMPHVRGGKYRAALLLVRLLCVSKCEYVCVCVCVCRFCWIRCTTTNKLFKSISSPSVSAGYGRR